MSVDGNGSSEGSTRSPQTITHSRLANRSSVWSIQPHVSFSSEFDPDLIQCFLFPESICGVGGSGGRNSILGLPKFHPILIPERSDIDTKRKNCSKELLNTTLPTFVDFFAGSGLVTQGAKHACTPVWSNDICPKKSAIYTANHGPGHFHLGSIEQVSGSSIPQGDIVWASFPCQDLSLAGKMGGLAASRSGLFWEWLRVLDEMPVKPAAIALENVVGLLSGNGGGDFRLLYQALRDRSYKVGPMLLDARLWVPQSRPRVFIVAVQDHLDTTALEDHGPNWLHPDPVLKAIAPLDDIVFWAMPRPTRRPKTLTDLIDWDAPVFNEERAAALISLTAAKHRDLLDKLPPDRRAAFPGYRRTRQGKQVLELRFDDLSGCLRTAEGGSSCQFLLLHDAGEWKARLITPREAALLMGAPRSYKLSKSYNESYNAMGDAVVVPVVKHLVDHLLVPLTQVHAQRTPKATPRVRLIA